MGSVNLTIAASVAKNNAVEFFAINELTPFQRLRRTCMNCLLWEDGYNIDGISIADEIKAAAQECSPAEIKHVVEETKFGQKLRHVPLYLLTIMAELQHEKGEPYLTKDFIQKIITRVDDMIELIALWWKDGRRPLPAVFMRALKEAFGKFDEYQFAKGKMTNRALKLRDVIALVHPKPENEKRSELYKRIRENKLATPDTWETAISAAGKDEDKKKAAWMDLLLRDRLPQLAFIRNLRNLTKYLPESLIEEHLVKIPTNLLNPYQIIQGWRMCNERFTNILDNKLMEAMKEIDYTLDGRTALLVDVSGSMEDTLSKGALARIDAASGVAAILRSICENVTVYTFDNSPTRIPEFKGLALVERIYREVGGGTSIYESVNEVVKQDNFDRIIIITDEQDNRFVESDEPARHFDDLGYETQRDYVKGLGFEGRGYIVNVSLHKHGVYYQRSSTWTHIDGWSYNVPRYIAEIEKFNSQI